MTQYKTIAETNQFIVLENYEKIPQPSGEYQSEADLERELMQDLIHQGYENPQHLTTPQALLANIREQLQKLNQVTFSDAE